ncbi:MAG TPA: TolC family protein [Phycisphaerae bacterium]|nr:TolC family protein [Phycisphaerae bacterium]HNU44261.1 TolC family protein [Phycisphaerae bacterium]
MAGTAVVHLMLCLGGCSLYTRDYYEDYRQPPQQLRELTAVRLEEMARSQPVSVAQAEAAADNGTALIAEPPEALEITLAEVRAAALANNLDLKVELVNPSLAEETVNEERARFEAVLFGSVGHSVTDRPATVVGGQAAQSQSASYDVGVRIPLRTGGTFTVDLPVTRFDDRTPGTEAAGGQSGVIDPSYDAGLQFSISQPLLRNAGVRANTHAIRVARYERDIADARTKLAAIRILANADRAYWLLYAVRRELEVRQQQYELAVRQLQDAEKRVAAGDAPEIEIMRAQSGVAARLEAIIIADTEVRRAQRILKRIMNRADLSLSSRTALLPTTDPNPLGLDLDPEALAEYGLTSRMEMLELELQLAIDASTVDLERNATLPLFVVDYEYRVNGFAGSWNGALRDVGGQAYADHALTLRAEIPLGNEAARSRLRQALLQRLQRLATREQRRLVIRQEVYDAVDALEQDWQRILAARQEVRLAGRTYEAEKRQFEVGLRTSTDVLEAAARLADAQSREIQALTAYEISQIDIAYATGTLIGRDRVIWEPVAVK